MVFLPYKVEQSREGMKEKEHILEEQPVRKLTEKFESSNQHL